MDKIIPCPSQNKITIKHERKETVTVHFDNFMYLLRLYYVLQFKVANWHP
jgi:hypothetical protein